MAHNTGLPEQYRDLHSSLKAGLPGISAWLLKFIVLFITSCVKMQQVNLVKVSNGFDTHAKKLSNLRRIQRHLNTYEWDTRLISKLIFSLLPKKDKYELLLDKTSWKFGCMEINIMMLAVAHEGLSIPLFWMFLDDEKGLGKDGASTENERIELMEKFRQLFGFECIEYLCADREFIGNSWMNYLIKNQVPFYIRIRNNAIVWNKGKKTRLDTIFRDIPINGVRICRKTKKVYGHNLYLSATMFLNDQKKPELLITASAQYNAKALKVYARRWQIETMFKAFKSNGFHLEDTHIKSLKSIDRLLHLVALAYTWAYMTGVYLNEIEPIRVLKHERREVSIYKKGYEFIQRALINLLTPQNTFTLKLSYT